MLGLMFKILLYVSSCIPVFIMVFLTNLKNFSLNELTKTYTANPYLWKTLIILSVLSLFSLIGWLIILYNISGKENENKKIKVEDSENNDAEVLNFFITFIVPVLSLKIDSNPSIVMNLILLIMEGIFFIRNNTLHFNIWLVLLGYHVYKLKDGSILITRYLKSDLSTIDSVVAQVGTTNISYKRKLKA